MELDYGRKQDLEILYAQYRKAGASERKSIERTIASIMQESGRTREYRSQLMKAFRVGDKNRIRYCQTELRRIKMDETGGRVQV